MITWGLDARRPITEAPQTRRGGSGLQHFRHFRSPKSSKLFKLGERRSRTGETRAREPLKGRCSFFVLSQTRLFPHNKLRYRTLVHKFSDSKLPDSRSNINLINRQPIQAGDTNADIIIYRSASTQADITALVAVVSRASMRSASRSKPTAKTSRSSRISGNLVFRASSRKVSAVFRHFSALDA